MALTDDQLERYARHIILREVGGAGQARLLASKVLLIGAGGLGSPLLLYLAAAGVGTIGVVDDDVVSLSNLQRQIIHETADIGRLKTESALETSQAINPDIKFIPHTTRLTAENATDILSGYDVVADGSDNFETRFLVADTCHTHQIPLVSAAIGQFEGQLSTWKPFVQGPTGEPYPCFRCLFPSPPPPESVQNCAEAGVLGVIAGVMGSLQGVEVLKELLDLPETMAGRLLLYDALETSFREIKITQNPKCPSCRS